MILKSKKLVSRLVVVTSLILFIQLAHAELKIGIIGDQTGAPTLSDLTGPYEILTQGVNILKGQGVKAVIHTGDLVESTLTEDKIKQNFNEGTAILNQLGVSWYLAAGDHDVNPPVYVPNSTDRSRETLFKSLYSSLNPKVKDNLYYSFDVENHHFIVLYSEEHLHIDPRWGNVFFNQASDQQMQWLKSDLEANKTKPGIIVYLHQPMWYNWSSWAPVHELLRNYPVAAVIAGHFHYNQWEGTLDGITYLVVGATGGETKNGTSNAGDIQHVTVMTINGKTVDFNPIPIDTSPMTFTSRYLMDRLQAVDQTLGNIWNFGANNPVFLKGNKLVNSCASDDPAQIILTGLGNPTEWALNMGLKFRAPDLA